MAELTPGAIDAASRLLAHLDADHIIEIRSVAWSTARDRTARVLDAFAAEAVQREREKLVLTGWGPPLGKIGEKMP